MSEFGDLNKKSYFEQLQISKNHVKTLLVENGKLTSYIDELENTIKELKKPILTKDEKISFKQGLYYEQLKCEIKQNNEEIRKLNKEKNRLFEELILLKNK